MGNRVTLTNEEKTTLQKIIDENKESERSVLRAKILLESDVSNNEKYSIPKLAEKLGTTHTTVQTVRTAYATGGLEEAVFRKKRTVEAINRRINPAVTEQILQMASEEPPEGFKLVALL